MPTGGKLWRWKYRFDGKEKLMALGSYPDVSLAVARERHAEGRRLLAAAVDPMARRRDAKAAEHVTSYLEKAHRIGLLDDRNFPGTLENVISDQARRRWNIHITPMMSKQHFLGYAGRYIRRPPISSRKQKSSIKSKTHVLGPGAKLVQR